MTLWGRIERWRSATKAISAEGAERPLEWEGKDILRMCADEIEADLRELQKLGAAWRNAVIKLNEGVKDSPSYDLKRMIKERGEAVTICADELEQAIGPLRS